MAKIEELYDFIGTLDFVSIYDARRDPVRSKRCLSYRGKTPIPMAECMDLELYATHAQIERYKDMKHNQPHDIEILNRTKPEDETTIQRFIAELTKTNDAWCIQNNCRPIRQFYGKNKTQIHNANDVFNLIKAPKHNLYGLDCFELTHFVDIDKPDKYTFYILDNLISFESILIDIYSDRMELYKLTRYVPQFDYHEIISRETKNGASTVKQFIDRLSTQHCIQTVYGGFLEQEAALHDSKQR